MTTKNGDGIFELILFWIRLIVSRFYSRHKLIHGTVILLNLINKSLI